MILKSWLLSALVSFVSQHKHWKVNKTDLNKSIKASTIYEKQAVCILLELKLLHNSYKNEETFDKHFYTGIYKSPGETDFTLLIYLLVVMPYKTWR